MSTAIDYSKFTAKPAPAGFVGVVPTDGNPFIDPVRESHKTGEWMVLELPRVGTNATKIKRDGTVVDTGVDAVVSGAISILRGAGREVGVSIRTRVMESTDPANIIVAFIAVDKIERPRKNASTDVPADVPADASTDVLADVPADDPADVPADAPKSRRRAS